MADKRGLFEGVASLNGGTNLRIYGNIICTGNSNS